MAGFAEPLVEAMRKGQQGETNAPERHDFSDWSKSGFVELSSSWHKLLRSISSE